MLLDRSSATKSEPEVNLDAIDTIGTWGHRVLRFQPQLETSSPTHIPGTPDEPELQPRTARARKRATRGDDQERQTSTDDEAAAVNAAWKWRFNRRWRTEQVEFSPSIVYRMAFESYSNVEEPIWTTPLPLLLLFVKQ